MALPEFVDNATGLDDGIANKLAGGLSKLRTAQREMNSQLAGVEDLLSTIDGESLPNLPTINDIQNKAGDIQSTVGDKIGTLSEINDLTGGCLDSALGAANSIARDGYGFIQDLASDFQSVANMPAEMFNVYELYAQAQEFANSLGIAELIADINGLLGCDSASSMVSDVNNEINSIMGSMGLNTDGTPDPDSYYNKMKSELATAAGNLGIPTSFTDSMSDGLKEMTTQVNTMATQAKDAASAQMASVKSNIKSSIPKTPTPPSFF